MEISKSALMSYQYQRQESSALIELQKWNENTGNMVSFEGNAYSMTESMSFSTSDGSRTLDVVYERTISAIEVEIGQISSDNPSVAPYLDALDYSPEATAERIASFATGFFDVHKSRNEDLSEEDALSSYMDIIKEAIDKGFGEARDILDSINVLKGDIKDNVDKTYDLVQEKLELFENSFSFGDDKYPQII